MRYYYRDENHTLDVTIYLVEHVICSSSIGSYLSENARQKDKRYNFCENNYSESLKLPVDYSPVNFIVMKFKINFKSDVHHTFGQNVY